MQPKQGQQPNGQRRRTLLVYLKNMKKLKQQLEKNQIRAVNAWAKYRELGGHVAAVENYQQYSTRIRAEKWAEKAENMRREIIATEFCGAEEKRLKKNFNAMHRDLLRD